jgi:hypothetical protein
LERDRIPLSQQRVKNCDPKAVGQPRWMRDKSTLAEYNVADGCTLVLDRYVDEHSRSENVDWEDAWKDAWRFVGAHTNYDINLEMQELYPDTDFD